MWGTLVRIGNVKENHATARPKVWANTHLIWCVKNNNPDLRSGKLASNLDPVGSLSALSMLVIFECVQFMSTGPQI